MPITSPAPSIRAIATLLFGAAAAVLCERLGTPLPWMIGPLLATAVATLSGAPVLALRPLRNAGQWAIGVALGLNFTPQVVGIVAGHWLAIVLGIVWALGLGAAFGLFLRWCHPPVRSTDATAGMGAEVAALDRPTAFFASAIGGASEMAVLAERYGGRVDLVASAHSLRILIVVVVIPFGLQLAGLHGLDPTVSGPQVVQPSGLAVLVATTVASGCISLRAGLSNAWMLGPLAAAFAFTAGGIELSALPPPVVLLGQLFIGVGLGAQFTPAFIHRAPRWLASVAAGTLVMMLACAGFAYLVARASGLHPATVLLGTSPGGIAEMCITAKVLQLGVPVVTAFHVTRMVAVVVLAGPMYRWARARDAAPG